MDPTEDNKQVPTFIKPEDLHLYESAKFIDVRDSNAYDDGHINNAVSANDFFTYLLSTSYKDDIDKMRTYFQLRLGQLGINRKDHIIVYEQSMNKQYGASCRALFILKHMKHPNVSTLEGGLDALIRLKDGTQQVVKETPVISPCQYFGEYIDEINETDWQMADRDEILQIAKSKLPTTYLLDVRDADEWYGLSSSPYGVEFTPRKGRIPNSIWIEWYKFYELDSDNNIIKSKSNEQVQALMEEKGILKDDHIIIYCFKGSRAAVALMKLKQAGYKNVKNYFASWNEWSRDFQLPIDDKPILEITKIS